MQNQIIFQSSIFYSKRFDTCKMIRISEFYYECMNLNAQILYNYCLMNKFINEQRKRNVDSYGH